MSEDDLDDGDLGAEVPLDVLLPHVPGVHDQVGVALLEQEDHDEDWPSSLSMTMEHHQDGGEYYR